MPMMNKNKLIQVKIQNIKNIWAKTILFSIRMKKKILKKKMLRANERMTCNLLNTLM